MVTGLVSALTFLLGFSLGHWLAFARDKRKEFNEAVTPTRGWLLKAKDSPSPFTRWPSEQEIDRFTHYLWPWQRRAFFRHLRCYKEMHESQQVQDSIGEVSYRSDVEIRRKLNELFRYTSLR